jgi:diguanylate cyclase (GGDEF)-like protein/PAS domain S-box-containing protein
VRPDQAGQAWLDALPDPIVAIDGQGRLGWANRAAITMFGASLEDHVGTSALDMIHPDDRPFALLSLDSLQSKDVGTLIEVRVRTSTGWRLVELVGANRLVQPGIESLLITMRDLTDRRRWEVGRGDDAMFRAVVHNAASLLILVGTDGSIRAISGAVTRLLGRDPETIEGLLVLDLVCTEDRRALARALAECRSLPSGVGEPVTVEAGLLDGAGQSIPFELTLVDMADDPTVPGVVVSAHNITKLRAYQKALADMARKDPLTLLPNRSAVDERLGVLLEQKITVAVAFVDLDGFKALNDRHGHHYGDMVLQAVGERLSTTVRPADLVGRYGGDEFVVIAHDLSESARLDRRVAMAMSQPVRIGEGELVVQASVGVTYTRFGDTVTSVLARADRAMYDSKGPRHRMGAVASR